MTCKVWFQPVPNMAAYVNRRDGTASISGTDRSRSVSVQMKIKDQLERQQNYENGSLSRSLCSEIGQILVSLGYSHEKGLVWNAMGTDTVRRGGTMGVRINDIFVWLRRSWSKKEVRRVLSLEGRVGLASSGRIFPLLLP